MKLIKYITATLCMLLVLGSCKDDSADNPTFDDDEIAAIYMDWASDFVYPQGDVIKFEAQVSPMENTKCRWLIDGEVVAEGVKIEHTINTEEDSFTLRFEAERNGKVNFRTAEVTIVKEFVPKEYDKMVMGVITENGNSGHVQWNSITHLMFSSLVVKEEDGSLTLPDDAALARLKTIVALAHNRGIYVLVDVSGPINYPTAGSMWGHRAFNMTAIDPIKRAKLTSDIVKFVEDYDLDGVNIYMNNISHEDEPNPLLETDQIAEFMNELGKALPEDTDEGRRKIHVTASVPQVWNNALFNYLGDVERLDWVNFLLFGTTDLAPTHHAPDWNIGTYITNFAEAGIPPSKAVIGIGAFGIQYDIPAGVTPGWGNLDQYLTYSTYSEILKMDSNAAEKDELTIGSGSLYYTGAAGAVRKAEIAATNGAAGMLIWMVEYDTSVPGQSLTQAVYNHLNP